MDYILNGNFINIVPTVVILISAIIYYFGVRWGETHVEECNVASHYFAGVLFIINFVLKPYVIIRFIEFIFKHIFEFVFDPIFEVHTFHLSISAFENILFFNIFLYIVSFLLIFFEYIILRFVRSNIKRFEEMLKSLDKFNEFDCTKIKTWEWLLLEFVPYLVIFILYTLYELNESYKLSIPLIILPSFLIAFLTFTNLAFCAGYCEAHYPKAVIYCKDGTIIKGIILKYATYIYLLTENEKYVINRDEICYIEEKENSKKLCVKYFTFVYLQECLKKRKK